MVLAVLAGYQIRTERKPGYEFSGDAQDGGYVVPSAAYRIKSNDKDETYVQIQINGYPEAVGSRCNLMPGNPEGNRADMQVRLVLDETGEEIFCSEVLKPGRRNVYVDLNRILKRGEYAATATFSVLDGQGQITAEVDAGVWLTVN